MVDHPQRYPQHEDPEKGQVYGGVCNITACERPRAVFWNSATHGLYCAHCALDINNHDIKDGTLCINHGHKPETIEEMDAIDAEFSKKPRHGYSNRGVHMTHCNQGKYEGGCKFGEDSTCPAL